MSFKSIQSAHNISVTVSVHLCCGFYLDNEKHTSNTISNVQD